MLYKNVFKAALLGLAVIFASPPQVNAETLQVMRGEPSSSLKVSMNRAVVVESDTPFGELSIANPGIADISTLSDRTIYVLGKTPGRTTLTLLTPEGRLITNVDVQVTPDVAEFKERLQQILPGERIEVRTANDGIVLSGTVSSLVRLDRALDLADRYAPGRVSNLMNVGGNHQVMLEVKFAEVNRTVSKQIGIGLGLGDPEFPLIGATGGGVDFNIDDDNNLIGTLFSVADSFGGAQVATSFGVGSLQIDVLLEALESKGLVRTLAEPNLTALSGQEANFLAGGEFPIPVPDDDGITIDFKPFGVGLSFIPTVVDGKQINLQLSTEVSALDAAAASANGLNIPAFATRRASTTVELRDGESFAIAGLLQDDFRDGSSQVPWLGDIPILGALFRSTSYQRDQSELVIIVTAHLVTPTRGEALALPTDRVRPPSEAELFLFGKMAGSGAPSGAAGEVAKQDFSGSYGYVME